MKTILELTSIFMFLFLFCSCDGVTITTNTPAEPLVLRIIDQQPSWSPDGHTIAYYHYDTSLSTSGIYLIDTNGTNKRQLTSGRTQSPDFSPDGNWIVYDSWQIFRIKVNGDSLFQLTNNFSDDYYPSWSNDGNWITYSHYSDSIPISGIWKVNKDTSIRINLTPQNHSDYYMSSWSPDGKYILHVRAYESVGFEIFIMDSSGESPIRLTFNNTWDLFPRFSPDGQKIIFTQESDTGYNYQIFSMNSNGTDILKLTDTQGFTSDYSPDGERIVYCDSSPGTADCG